MRCIGAEKPELNLIFFLFHYDMIKIYNGCFVWETKFIYNG